MPPCQVCAKSAETCCSRCKVAYFCSSHCQTAAWGTHKSICKRLASLSPISPSTEKRATVLIIGAFERNFHSREEDLLSELQRRSSVIIAQDITTSIAGLDLKPEAILLVDARIMEAEWQNVLQRVIDASKVHGCRLVLGGDFSSIASRMDGVFQALRVPWRYKDYFRTEFKLSPSCNAPIRQTVGLAESFSMKACHLDGVGKTDALYVVPSGAKLQSAVFLQEPVTGKAGCGVAYMKYGKGWLGYSGDNNKEGATTRLQLAMCGLTLEDCTLPDQSTRSPTASLTENVTAHYSGLSGVTNPPASDPSQLSIATDVDFWWRSGMRISTDTTPRQSRWDPNRETVLPSFPGLS